MLEHPDPELHRLLAVAELRRGNLAEAAAAIDRAIPEAGDAAPDVTKLEAQILYAARDWPNALRSYRELRARRIDLSPNERIQFAVTLYESKRPDEGRKALRKLLKRERIPAKAAIEYARWEGANDPDGAYASLETVLKYNPVEPEVLAGLTEIDVANGRSPQALTRLRRAIDTGRAAAAVVLLRADVLARVGRLEQAEAHALRAFEADPTLVAASDLLFDLYRRQGELDSARRSFADADAAGVLHPGAIGLLGRLYEHAGQIDAACEAYERSLAALPDASIFGARLAFLLALQDRDLDRALAFAEAARPLASERAHVADAIGYVYFKKGQNRAAVRLFEDAIVLAEAERIEVPEYHYHLGLVLRALARNEEAASAFGRALELDDSFDDADDARQQLEATRHGEATASSPS
jgi:tetratricopeptide (TPR) repeat protein